MLEGALVAVEGNVDVVIEDLPGRCMLVDVRVRGKIDPRFGHVQLAEEVASEGGSAVVEVVELDVRSATFVLYFGYSVDVRV